ncbi:MAG: YCF48-related protein [Candidatus Poribacteria bacterium]|nr:YCF48-related protein [Candidatus Poribacteria bacterium]
MTKTIITLFATLIGVAIFFSYATVSEAEWTVLREDDILRGDGIDGMLQDVYFMDNQNGLVVGNGGLMLKTSDGGKTWEKIEVDMRPPGAGQRPGGGGGPPAGFGRGGPAPLYNIYFINENVGYITGGRGTILKTEDGGKTWARKMARSDTPGRGGRPGGIRANLMGIQMINETTGFIAGSENTILKTTDGGETWIGSSERARVGETRNNLENILFVSPTTGWVIGSFGTLLHTTDGGKNWEKRDPGFDNNLFGIHFLDENTGWICGQEGLILHTTDGGATWNQQKTESYDDLHDIIFVDAMVGWAVGGYNSVLHTTDGGQTWTVSNIPGGATFKGVHATDANNCWTVNDWGVIAGYKSQE